MWLPLLGALWFFGQSSQRSPFNSYQTFLEPRDGDDACHLNKPAYFQNRTYRFRGTAYPQDRAVPLEKGQFEERNELGGIEWSMALERQESHHPRYRACFLPHMTGRECHHCKQFIAPGEVHDCWTTTEAALTADLSEDLLEAWERLRETAADFGDQRIYASGTAIMFSRKSCYFFVRPRRKDLQVCIFLGRAVRAPQVRRVERKSASKLVHIVHITHRDEVESPLTDWLREAYDLQDQPAVARARPTGRRKSTGKLTARRNR